MAWGLLRQNVMVIPSMFGPRSAAAPPLHTIWSRAFSSLDRRRVLRFAASFLWADLEVAEAERHFLLQLAHELELDDAVEEVEMLLARPPVPEEVDPAEVTPGVADLVRQAVLRAIAADGRVGDEEMKLFELLDDLLPKRLPRG